MWGVGVRRFESLYQFFFSSRRRHTRSKRDWSSDVCSSDLERVGRGRLGWASPYSAQRERKLHHLEQKIGRASCRERVWISEVAASLKQQNGSFGVMWGQRSEWRRGEPAGREVRTCRGGGGD